MKKLLLASMASVLTFAACSSEKSNEPDFGGTGELQGFLPTEMTAYEIDNDMNVIKTVEPVCKEEKRELAWSRTSSDTTVIDFKYDSKNGIVTLGDKRDAVQYDYLGSSFPKGSWRLSNSDNDDGKFLTQGMVFDSDKIESGIAYSGNCFLKDVYAGQLAGGIIGDEDSEEYQQATSFMKYITIECDKVSIGDSVEIKVGKWSRNGVETKYTYGKTSCTNKVTTRFAYNESDCKAAYNEFKENAKASDEFDFDDYATANSNQECYDSFTEYAVKYLFKLAMEDALGGLGGGEGGFNLDDFLNGFGGSDAKAASAKKIAKGVASLKLGK